MVRLLSTLANSRGVGLWIDCLACSFETDLCSINPLAEIHDEETEPFFSFGDVNWAGIDYRLRIRIYKTNY